MAVSLRQNGVGASFVGADAILAKGHRSSMAKHKPIDWSYQMSKLMLIFALILLCIHSVSGRAINDGETPASSRLTILQEQLKTGDQSALEVFWKEIIDKGAPLIETIKGDTQHVLVTFLWRAKSETKNVYLFAYALTFPDEVGIRQGQLNRLSDTDIWFKSYVIRSDARITYVFSPNDSLVPEDMQKRRANIQPDPLNPKRGFGLESPDASILELPGLPPPTWTKKRPDAPIGKVEERRFKSILLNNERALRVYTPSGYKPTGSAYGLLILFDAQYYANQAPTVLDNLIADGATAPMVAVMIDCEPSVGRLNASNKTSNQPAEGLPIAAETCFGCGGD